MRPRGDTARGLVFDDFVDKQVVHVSATSFRSGAERVSMEHVLAHCRITQHLRDAHGDPVNFPEILHAIGVKDFRLIHGILQSY